MKTKIVYVVASLDDDIYMEQAIVSAWSARHFNPDCRIEMVCDQDTYATLNSGIRAQYKNLFDQIHVREFLPEQGMKERSRWLKTTLREIVEGDYLYLDTDTVVCADLSYVDDFKFDMGMVLDDNCILDKGVAYERVVRTMKTMFDMDVQKETIYFNSGVAFVRNCLSTHDFYKLWHELWLHSLRKYKDVRDQQPLMKANIDRSYFITEMSGNLNCQVGLSIQYLYTAHVIHFFNELLGKCNDVSPFFNDIYQWVKSQGITLEIERLILNCKTSFNSPSMPVSREGAMLWRHHIASGRLEEKIKSSNSYHAILFFWTRLPWLMRLIEKFWAVLIRISHLRKKIF